jgi:hypothetical protein
MSGQIWLQALLITVEWATCWIANALIASCAVAFVKGTNADAVAIPKDKRSFIMNQD